MAWYDYPAYVPVAQRRLEARRVMTARAKKGLPVEAVTVTGRAIARSFWGKAWCDHLESYSDYANRLPRGRTYVRNGSVVHLGVSRGKVDAFVQGTELYEVTAKIAPLARKRWEGVVGECAGAIDSLVELLQGKLSHGVMTIVTDRKRGLFPAPGEIDLACSCPDWAGMCKHVAAVLYGVGARLDDRPELLFVLRGVDHLDLLSAGTSARGKAKKPAAKALARGDLSDVFGIEIDAGSPPPAKAARPARKGSRRAR